MIKLEDFKKIDMRIGKVDKTEGDIAHIKCPEKFIVKNNIGLKENDEIVVVLGNGKLLIPVINDLPILPDKYIEPGSKIR